MSAFRLNRRYLSYLAALIGCFTFVSDCQAQQSEQSLFVIKTPAVQKTVYGERPDAIRFAQLGEQEDEAPGEDLSEEPGSPNFDALEQDDDLMKDIKKLDDMITDEDRDMLDEDFDDEQIGPPRQPMTTWNLKPMTSITPGIRPVAGTSPSDQSWQLTSRAARPLASSQKLFAWASPDIKYNPLYFEDVALERYGQTRGLIRQQFASGLHFLKSATFLPYYTLYDPINSCDGPLGYCRPGVRVNCATQKHYFGNPFQRR